ncbi:unnamed protein product [Musa acuminata subsp. burmannicoides]
MSSRHRSLLGWTTTPRSSATSLARAPFRFSTSRRLRTAGLRGLGLWRVRGSLRGDVCGVEERRRILRMEGVALILALVAGIMLGFQEIFCQKRSVTTKAFHSM